MIVFYDERSTEYSRPEHPECPARITQSASLLRERHPDWDWRRSAEATKKALLRAHSPEHIERVRRAAQDFDADTPAYPNIFKHAARAAGAAIDVAREATNRNRSFSLMRPPGHHATHNRAMGFCYFCNIAIAALDALNTGTERVAIWDFDAHHGNGTEAIVAHNPGIAFASIHQFPAYPGTGKESFANVTNLPVAPLTARPAHVAEVARGLERILAFKPELLLVSAGFDAYAGDPLTQMTLEREDFTTFAKWLRDCGVAVSGILEGGYSSELPELIDAFLSSWAGTEILLGNDNR